MIRKQHLITIFCLMAGSCFAQSQPLPNPWLQKIHDVLTTTHPDPWSGGLVLVRPAFALDTWMDGADPANRRALSNLLDGSAGASALWQTSTAKLSAAYADILDNARWAKSTLSNDERTRLSSALQTLFVDNAHTTPTSGYRNYLSLKKKVDDLQTAWDTTAPPDRTATMASDLDEAKQNLAFNGDPQVYIDALSAVQSLTRPSPIEIRNQRKQQYDSSLIADPFGNSFAPTGLGSDYTPSVTSQDWTAIVIEQGSSAVPVTGVWGYESENGSLEFSDSQATHVVVSFEYTVVPISRPWFDSGVFDDRSWRWKTPDTALISDGVNTSDGPSGTFPNILSAAVLARNISIRTDLPPTEQTALQKSILAGRRATWGPFLVAGRYFDPRGRVFAASRVGTTLVIDDVQLIGFLTTALPKSPNPDPKYDWQP